MRGYAGPVAGLILAAATAEAGVAVRFVEPQLFSDVESDGSGRSRDAALAALEAHLRRLTRRLPEGHDLWIDVLDVDLAGEEGIGRGGGFGQRLVTASTPPRLRLRWGLTAARQIVASGEETLADSSFLPNGGARSSDPELFDETELLSAWFTRHFGALSAAPRRQRGAEGTAATGR